MRQLLLSLAANQQFKNFTMRFPPTRRLARRFVAGETLDDALIEVEKLNKMGISATVDHLGEHVSTKPEALKSAETYFEILDQIDHRGLDSHVSLKLTQMGLALDEALCLENVSRIVKHAKNKGTFVRMDMEDSSYTDKTLNIYRKLKAHGLNNVGVVLQSYLFRSRADIESLIPLGLNVRLCKGAYSEPPSVAFPKKSDVDRNFLELVKMLFSQASLQQGAYVAIATHDERIVEQTKQIAHSSSIPKTSFEYQMLYGIRRDLQKALARDGFRVRVYVSYGREWYPYFMRRLAERPANLFFLLRNLFKD